MACTSSSAQTKNLNVDEFVKTYKTTKNAQLLDVRTPNEWASGKLGSSKCVDFLAGDFKQNIEKLDKTKPVFVYCAAGGRSAKATAELEKAGFKNIYNLSGAGYAQLAAKGLK